MKSWFTVIAALLFCGSSSYVSADEYLYRDSVNSRLHLISLQTPSAGSFDDTADITTAYSGGIFSTEQHLELTPMIGYTFGGRFDYLEGDSEETIRISDASSYGFRLGYDLGYDSQIEFSYSRQETKITGGDLFPRDALFNLDVDYYHIGGSLLWNRGDVLEPYFTGTLGLTNFNPEDPGADSLTRFSMGFGGGVRIFPIRRIGIYTGARGLVTFVNTEITAYSGSEGAFVKIRADAVWQFQVYAGLIVTF